MRITRIREAEIDLLIKGFRTAERLFDALCNEIARSLIELKSDEFNYLQSHAGLQSVLTVEHVVRAELVDEYQPNLHIPDACYKASCASLKIYTNKPIGKLFCEIDHNLPLGVSPINFFLTGMSKKSAYQGEDEFWAIEVTSRYKSCRNLRELADALIADLFFIEFEASDNAS